MSSERKLPGTWVCVLLLVVIGLLARINLLWLDFASDDINTIISNAALHNLRNIPDLFSAGLWPAGSANEITYRPLLLVLFSLEYALWGNHPSGYHLIGLLLHIAASCMVFAIVRRLVDGLLPALAAGLLFSLHPVQTEVAAWISAGCGSLAALLVFTAFFAYLKHRQERSVAALGWSLGLYFLACFAKEDAYTLVAAIVLCELLLFNESLQRRAILALAFGMVGAGAYLIRAQVVGSLAGDSLPLLQRLLTAPGIYLTYLKNLLFPLSLQVYYDIPVQTVVSLRTVILPIAVLFAVLAPILLYGIKKDRRVLFAVGWIIIVMLPFSGLLLFPRPALMADRYMYIAFFGIALLVALGVQLSMEFWEKAPAVLKRCGICAATLLMAGFIVLSVQQSRVWASDETFYAAYLAHAPDSPRAHNGMGVNLYNRGDYRGALQEFQRAVELHANYQDAYFNSGKAFLKLGDENNAIIQFSQTLKVNPRFADAHFELGNLLIRQGDLDKAVQYLNNAVRIDPNQPRYRAKLDLALRLKNGTNGGRSSVR